MAMMPLHGHEDLDDDDMLGEDSESDMYGSSDDDSEGNDDDSGQYP